MGIYIDERIIEMAKNGGKTSALLDCLQIEIDTTMEFVDTFSDDAVKSRFYANHYFKLVENLKELGLIK